MIKTSSVIFLSLFSLILSLSFFPQISYSDDDTPIVIGSKNFSESIILGEMIAVLLEEKYHQTVIRKLSLGGTKVAFDALTSEAIHVYPDYTGTGYVMILKMDGERNPAIVHEIVSREFKKRWGIIWSKPLGFNNTYALAVRRDDPRFKGITKISQLSGKVQDYRYAGAYEFMERADGHPGFVKSYDLNFKPDNIISMEPGLMYSAVKEKQVDMIVAYSTDGRIKAYNLRIIKDDLHYFPPYFVSFIAKEDILEEFPELADAIHLLEGQISEAEMMTLNNQVDQLKAEPKAVARNFLLRKGLLNGEVTKLHKKSGLFSYFIRRRAYIFKLLKEHLMLSFGALFFAILISLPTGIALTRYPRLSKLVFPIVNTIQTIPSLALLGFLIPLMGIGLMPAMLALFLYSLLPLVRNTYTGIQGVDRNYIEASRGIGLTNFQILWKVEIPLALPVIIAGVRTAAVIVIGTATLAALIGAGGFGDPIFRGVSTVNSNLILLGAIPAAALAIVVDKFIGTSEKLMVSKGIRLKAER